MSSSPSGFRTSYLGLRNKIGFLLSAVLGVLLFSAALFSQGSFGRILGTVTDQTGGVISGATVTIIDKDRGPAATLTTDAAGEYNAPTLLPGTYIIRAEAQGFKRLERQNVVLEVGREVRIDLTVQPGEQTQSVTVTEAIPLVETTNATLGGTLSNADVVDLPLNGRLYINLLSLRPGVVAQPGGTMWTQSTNGGRPDETVWMLDGVINTSFFDASPLAERSSPLTDGAAILPVDAIQEFTMQENPKAEYGWRPGAVVNAGVKSGTNNLHGSAYAFGRDAGLDARDAFNPGPASDGTCVPNPTYPAQCNKLPTRLEQFGATVGGPIKKDKLFFFAGYEGLRDFVGNVYVEPAPAIGTLGGPVAGFDKSMPDTITAIQKGALGTFTGLCTVASQTGCLSPASLAIFGCTGIGANGLGTPTCTGGLLQNAPSTGNSYQSSFPNTNASNNGVAKLEYRINNKNLITGLVFVSNYTSTGEDHAISNASWEQTIPISVYTYTGNWVYTPSSSWVNDARVSYNRFNFKLNNLDTLLANGTSYPINTGVTSTPGFPSIFMQPFGTAGGDLLGTWRGRPGPITSPDPYYDIQDSVSYLRGKHSLKFGGDFTHIEVDDFTDDTRGRINFGSLADFFSGNPSGGTLFVNPQPLKLRWTSTAGFIQDDWRVTPRLMVNLGLRYSYVSPFKEAHNLIANFDPTSPTGLVQQGQNGLNTLFKPDYKDFSPRLGFAWDVTGKGTTVVRGGGSIIYSMWQMAAFFNNPGPAGDHNHQTSPAANPTGFTCVVGPGCPNGTFGGTINTGVVSLSSSAILWNSAAAEAPGGPGILPTPATVTPTCAAKKGVGTCDLFGIDPNLKYPYVVSWNLGITHAFTSNTSLEVGYVGTHGAKLSLIQDINAYEVVNGVTTTTQPYAAKFPNFDAINWVSNGARSNYNGLQSTLIQRVTHGLSFTAGYTYSHSLDNGSLSRFGAVPQNQYDPLADYGNSDLDVRHRFTISGTYALPGKKGFAQLLEGWSINSVVSINSALPWGPNDTGNGFSANAPRGGEQTDRWDFFGNPADFKSGESSIPYCTGPGAGGCTVTSGISGVTSPFSAGQSAAMWNQCLAHAADTSAGGTLQQGGCFVSGNSVMTPPAANHFGNMGRNLFRDTGFKDWDFSIFKNFTFTERLKAQFRFEVFNLLNTPIISNPYGAAVGYGGGNDPSAPSSFGCGCATPDIANGNALVGSGGPREMQLGLKFTF